MFWIVFDSEASRLKFSLNIWIFPHDFGMSTKSLRRHSHYAHCQPLQLTYGRASSSQVIYLLVFNICCSLPHFGTIGAFPFGRLTCVLSALPISPWSIRPRKQATFTRPSHSLGDCFVVGIVLFLMKLLLRWNFHPTFVATFHHL